jgi:hypothetical protein
MRSLDSHLDKQYTSGRIKGADYATVYLGALQTVLPQAIAFVLQQQKAEKEVDILDKQLEAATQDIVLKQAQSNEQIAASQANTAVKQQIANKQSDVFTKQAEGFDKDYRYKVSKALLDIRTTALTQGIEGISSEGGDSIVKDLLTEAGLPFNAYSGGAVPTGTGQFLIDVA